MQFNRLIGCVTLTIVPFGYKRKHVQVQSVPERLLFIAAPDEFSKLPASLERRQKTEQFEFLIALKVITDNTFHCLGDITPMAMKPQEIQSKKCQITGIADALPENQTSRILETATSLLRTNIPS